MTRHKNWIESHRKGELTQLEIKKQLIKVGYIVVDAPNGHCPWDLGIIIGSRFIKIQCKTAWHDKKTGTLHANTCSYTKGKYAYVRSYIDDGIDIFGICSPNQKECYFLLAAKVGRKKVRLRIAPQVRQKNRKCNWAKDYTDPIKIINELLNESFAYGVTNVPAVKPEDECIGATGTGGLENSPVLETGGAQSVTAVPD